MKWRCRASHLGRFTLWNNASVKSKLQHPLSPGHTPGFWHLCRPGEEGIWLSESSRVWGIWSPCVRGGEFELYPRFHVKSLAWRAVIRDAVLEDFRGKDCAFVANWLQGLCRIWRYLNFNIFNIGFRLWIYECIKLCLQWITIPTIKSSTEVNYFDQPSVC